jgi:hypothetical protein
MASRGKRPFDGSAFVSLRWSKSQRRDAEGPAGTPLNADLSQLDSRALPFSATTQPEFTVSPPSRGVSTPPCVAKPCSGGSLQLLFKLGLYRCVRVHTAARVFWRGWVVAGRNGGCNCLRIFKMPMTHTPVSRPQSPTASVPSPPPPLRLPLPLRVRWGG